VPVGPGADATLLGQGPRLGHRHGANGLGDLAVKPRAANRNLTPLLSFSVTDFVTRNSR
jgi:hypothetical protein